MNGHFVRIQSTYDFARRFASLDRLEDSDQLPECLATQVQPLGDVFDRALSRSARHAIIPMPNQSAPTSPFETTLLRRHFRARYEHAGLS
jgi:hypothetical protein